MITRVDNTVANLKNLWAEMFLNKTDKVSNIADGSVLNAMAFGTAKVAQKAIKDIAIVEAQIFPTSATGEYLDKAAALYGVSPRKQALGSSTYVRVSAQPGTQYEVGTNFLAKNGIRFVVDRPFTVDSSGYGYVSVRSSITGSVTNVEANSIVQVSPRPLTHIECTNEYAAIGGRDYEDDNTFRNRIINYNNKLSEETIESWTQIFQDLDSRILRVMNVGLGEDGKTHIYLVTQNGSFFTDAELETLLEKATPYFGLTELDLQGEAVGIVLENAKWMFIGGDKGVDFRVELSPNIDIATVRKNIQIAMTKYLDFRFWEAGRSVQWDDLLQVVKNSEGVKYVPDEYFFPYYDEEVPLNMLPRIKGFRMRDLEGNILYDSGSNLSNIFYPAKATDIFQGSQAIIASQKFLVSFTVTNTKNIPVPSAYITIGNKVIVTDAKGTSNILLENGEYQYILNKANWNQQSGEFVVLNGPIYITINDFTATPYEVSFTVYEGSAPLVGAIIQISTATLTTDTAGKAKIQLEPGTYSYKITKAGFKAIDSVLTVENQPIEIVERMFLETLPVYFAVIDRERGVYVPEANIQVIDQNKFTNIEGQAELGLQVGEYEVKVNKEGYQQYKQSLVVQGEDPNCVTIEMVAIPFEVKFTVLDSALNRPIGGVTVKVKDNTYITDDQGVAIVSLPNGTFEYTIFKSGYMPYTDFIVVDDASVSKIVKLEKAYYTFRLIVRDIETGNYIQGAEVTCNEDVTVTNVNGMANLSLPNGAYPFTVSARNYKKYEGQVVIKDQDEVLTIYIEIRDSVITYTATDELTGNPIENVLITLTNVGTGLTVDSGRTNAIGIIDLAAEAGDYMWEATHNYYLPESDSITIEKLKDQEVSFIMTRKEISADVYVTENLPEFSGDATTVTTKGMRTIEASGSDEYIYIAEIPETFIVPNAGAQVDLRSHVRTFRRLKEGGVNEPYDFAGGGATVNYNVTPTVNPFVMIEGSQMTIDPNLETRTIEPRTANVDVTVTTGNSQSTSSFEVDQKRAVNFSTVKAGLKINVKSKRDNSIKQYITDANGRIQPIVMPGVQYELTVAEGGFYQNNGLLITSWDFEHNLPVYMEIVASKKIEFRVKQANTSRPLSGAEVTVSGMSIDQVVTTGENGSAFTYISPISMSYSCALDSHNTVTGRFTPPLSVNYIDIVMQYNQITFTVNATSQIPYVRAAENCLITVTSNWGGTPSQQYTFTGRTDNNGKFVSTGNGQYNIPPGPYRITAGGGNSNFDSTTKSMNITLTNNSIDFVVTRRTITVTATIKEILPAISATANTVKARLVLAPFYNENNTSSGANMTTNASGQVTKTVYAGIPERFAVQPIVFYEGSGAVFTVNYSDGATQTKILTYTCSKRIPVYVNSNLYGRMQGATVTFKGMSVDQVQTTDNAGIAYIYLSPVVMTYIISKDYYASVTGNFTPVGTENSLEFTLEAQRYPVTFNISTGGILPPEGIIVQITNESKPEITYQAETNFDGAAVIPDVLVGHYSYKVLAGEIMVGVFDHPQSTAGTTLNVEVTFELINAQIEVKEIYGATGKSAALSNKTLTMTHRTGSVTVDLDVNGAAVIVLIKGIEYTFTTNSNPEFYSNPTQSYIWEEDGFVWAMNLNVTAQLTVNVKEFHTNTLIRDAVIVYNEQTQSTDAQGNAIFYRSAVTKTYSITKADYRVTTGNIAATDASPINTMLYRELQQVRIKVTEAQSGSTTRFDCAGMRINYSNADASGTITLDSSGLATFSCYLGIDTTFTVADHPEFYEGSQVWQYSSVGELFQMNLNCIQDIVVNVKSNVPAAPVNGASVVYFGLTKTTDANGNATFKRSGLDRSLSVNAEYLQSYSGTITIQQTSPVNIVLIRATNPVSVVFVETIPNVSQTFPYSNMSVRWAVGSTQGTFTTDANGRATFNGYLGSAMTLSVASNPGYYNNPTVTHTYTQANETLNVSLSIKAQIIVRVKSANPTDVNLASASVAYFGQTKTTDANGNATFYRSGLDRSITATERYHSNYSGTIAKDAASPFTFYMARIRGTVSIKVVEVIPNIAGTNIYSNMRMNINDGKTTAMTTLDNTGSANIQAYLGTPTTFSVVDYSNYYSNPSTTHTYTALNQSLTISLNCNLRIRVNVKSNVPADVVLPGATLTYFNQTQTTDASGNVSFYRSGLSKPLTGNATYFNPYIGTIESSQADPYNIRFTRTTVTVTLAVQEKLGSYTGAFGDTTMNRTVLGATTGLVLNAEGRKSNTVYAGITYSYTPASYPGYYQGLPQTHVWSKEGEVWTMTMISNATITFNIRSANYGWVLSGVSYNIANQTGTTNAQGNATVYRSAKTHRYSFSKNLYHTISGTFTASQASPVNLTLAETSSSITITVKDRYMDADRGAAVGCGVKLINLNLSSVVFEGTTNASGQVTFGPMIQGSYRLTFIQTNNMYTNVGSWDITMPTASYTISNTRKSKDVNLEWFLETGTKAFQMKAQNLFTPKFTQNGVVTNISLGLSGGYYKYTNYKFWAGLETVIDAGNALVFTGYRVASNTPYRITPDASMNISSTLYVTTSKKITITVLSSLTNQKVPSVTVKQYGINGDNSVSAANEWSTSHASGTPQVYVTGYTNRYIFSAPNYNTLEMTSASTTNFTVNMTPSQITLTITIKKITSDGSTGNAENCMVKLSSNNTETAYSGKTTSTGIVTFTIRPGQYYLEAGGSVNWGRITTDGNYPIPNRSPLNNFYSSGSTQWSAVFVSANGWFESVSSFGLANVLTSELIPQIYNATTWYNYPLTGNVNNSVCFYFTQFIVKNSISGNSAMFFTSGRKFSTNRHFNLNFVGGIFAGTDTSLMIESERPYYIKGKQFYVISEPNKLDSEQNVFIYAYAEASKSVTRVIYFTGRNFGMYRFGYYPSNSQKDLGRMLNSYSVLDGSVHLGQVSTGENYFLSGFQGNHLILSRSPSYGASGTIINTSKSTGVNLEMIVKLINFPELKVIVALVMENSSAAALSIRSGLYSIGSTNSDFTFRWKNANLPINLAVKMGANMWMSPNRDWLFYVGGTGTIQEYTKGLNTINSSSIGNGLINASADWALDMQVNSNYTAEMRSAVSIGYVQHIVFSEDSTKMILLMHNSHGNFNRGVEITSGDQIPDTHNPNKIMYFQFYPGLGKWLEIPSEIADKREWIRYYDAKMGVTKPSLGVLMSSMKRQYFSWADPGYSDNARCYFTHLTWGD